MINPVKKYPPGSKWLYIRIYGGPQVLEEWLINSLLDLLVIWKNSSLIKSFHYIHYLDPDYHLRLRFLLPDPVNTGIILNQIQLSFSNFLDEDLLWKIEVGTYEPEHDRYGISRMAYVEQWFEIDSFYWIKEIKNASGEESSEIWKSAIRSVYVLLDDFGAKLEDKVQIMNRLKESTTSIYGVSKSMRVQLDDKYRRMSGELYQLLDFKSEGQVDALINRSFDSKIVINQLKSTFDDSLVLFESRLIPDLIHMSLNRAFRTRHRVQELVVCDFLSRYFESARARGRNQTDT